MYDELIHNEIEHYGIEKPIKITPLYLKNVIDNFESKVPKNIVLTGTAGDGKTYHCRLVWEHFNGDPEQWREGIKVAELELPASRRQLCIIKDLSELTREEKEKILPKVAESARNQDSSTVYLVAANDGQLMASWRDFAEAPDRDPKYFEDFKVIEEMLIDEKSESENLSLLLYNLSRFDASDSFNEIINQMTEHPLWDDCDGCPVHSQDGSSQCPIIINRDRLRGTEEKFSPFRKRLTELLKIARANRMHLPIRDLILLCVNIILGDDKSKGLLTCRMAINRANDGAYHRTNPYANAFGANLRPRRRQQYQAFSTLETFGIGRETDNKIDNLLVYGLYEDGDTKQYERLIGNDPFYGGGESYKKLLQDYLEGERNDLPKFMRSLELQRQRLFFSLPPDSDLNPWSLSVYQSSGCFLEFGEKLNSGEETSSVVELLVRGLNRTFCGMMIDEDQKVYIASSGGDGRGRISLILKFEIGISTNKRTPYLDFKLGQDGLTPRMRIVDPVAEGNQVIAEIELQISHFEYLMRVAKGSLPASFSRQCYEDFLDFKLRSIAGMTEDAPQPSNIIFTAIKVDKDGRLLPDIHRIRIGEK